MLLRRPVAFAQAPATLLLRPALAPMSAETSSPCSPALTAVASSACSWLAAAVPGGCGRTLLRLSGPASSATGGSTLLRRCDAAVSGGSTLLRLPAICSAASDTTGSALLRLPVLATGSVTAAALLRLPEGSAGWAGGATQLRLPARTTGTSTLLRHAFVSSLDASISALPGVAEAPDASLPCDVGVAPQTVLSGLQLPWPDPLTCAEAAAAGVASACGVEVLGAAEAGVVECSELGDSPTLRGELHAAAVCGSAAAGTLLVPAVQQEHPHMFAQTAVIGNCYAHVT